MATHKTGFATDSMPERIRLTQELELLYKQQQEAEASAKLTTQSSSGKTIANGRRQ